LTVLLWPQVQNYSLTKLRLMLVGAMALAIQRFLGSNQRVGHQPTGGSMPHPGHRQRCDACRWLSGRRRPEPGVGVGGCLRPNHRQMVATPRCLWLTEEYRTAEYQTSDRRLGEWKRRHRSMNGAPILTIGRWATPGPTA